MVKLNKIYTRTGDKGDTGLAADQLHPARRLSGRGASSSRPRDRPPGRARGSGGEG
jgi:hypothetical protein